MRMLILMAVLFGCAHAPQKTKKIKHTKIICVEDRKRCEYFKKDIQNRKRMLHNAYVYFKNKGKKYETLETKSALQEVLSHANSRYERCIKDWEESVEKGSCVKLDACGNRMKVCEAIKKVWYSPKSKRSWPHRRSRVYATVRTSLVGYIFTPGLLC